MRLDIHHHHHYDKQHYDSGRMERVLLGRILNQLEKVMRTLEETLAAVEAETSSIQSISALLAGIKKQLDDALGGALTPSQQMRVDAIFNRATENKAAIDAAIKANDGVTDEDEKVETNTSVATSLSPANVGDTLIFSAQVEFAAGPNAVPTGSVTFTIDGNAVGTGSLDASGVAQFTFTLPMPAGVHVLKAAYAGDATFRASESDAVQQTIVAPGAQS